MTNDTGLTVSLRGDGRYRVSGGAEPHVVEIGTGAGARCDCRDFSFRGRARACKHIAVVRCYQAREADGREGPDAAMRAALKEGA